MSYPLSPIGMPQAVTIRYLGFDSKESGSHEFSARGHLFLVRLIVNVVIFRMAYLILVIDFKLLWRLGLIVGLTDYCLIFPRVFIVTAIVIILRAAVGIGDDLF
jgi:hypothetical protein